eukprot:TRINITY_DN25769_c0_g1_i1.p1 TRINITY_DN25769_c0_g1~~TRINITY_DN25769_c0_g1_i1.p1  ORF type:complete len:189 (-),score=27.45 TRINITY_DN25769_c0_g1_i1:118-684(-)
MGLRRTVLGVVCGLSLVSHGHALISSSQCAAGGQQRLYHRNSRLRPTWSCPRCRGAAATRLRMRRDDMGPEEWDVETKVAKLESSLSRAVKEERYAEASELRDALSRMHMDDYSAVLAANADFYSAFSKKNADKMASLWLDSDAVLCVHPGQEPLVGHEAVTKAWRGMFASGDAAFKTSVVQPAPPHA